MHYFMGKECILSIQDVNRDHNRFVGNMIEAMNNNAYSRLSVCPALSEQLEVLLLLWSLLPKLILDIKEHVLSRK